MTTGIDVSVHNGTIDWSKAAKKIDFAILRAGFGSVATQKDKNFDKNYDGCKKNGVKVGAYWYCYAKTVSAAQQEARVCLSILANRKFDYPIWYDIEEQSTFKTGKNTVSAIAKAFCETIKAAGYKTGVYSSRNGLENYITDEVKKNYDIWLANVGKNGATLSSTTYKGSYTMWQYSWVGKVDGISGNVDMDYCYKNYVEDTKPAEPSEPVAPPPSPNGINVYYKVSPDSKNWYPEVKNDTDYAGLDNKTVQGFTARVDKGQIKFRVHVKNGKWLGWISKYNPNDWNYGVAGIKGKPIDGIQIDFSGVEGYQVMYRVSVAGTSAWYPWVSGYSSNSNGYAGVYGKNIDKIQVKIVKK